MTSSFGVAYIVLAISAVFDLVSFRQSAGQMMGRARRHNRDLLGESRATSDPTLRAVFVEDMVSVSGDLITLATLGLNQVTGSSIPQGVAAVVIGLMLIRSSLRLGRRSHDFPLGAWLVTPATSGGRRRAARIDIDDHLFGARVKSLIRNLESDLKHEPEGIYRVDVVPVENDAP